VIVFGGIYFLLDLPLSYYSGFVLSHRFDQSTQSFKGWVLDEAKGLLIGAPLGLILVELLYLALRLTGPLWWLWAGLGMLFFTILIANLAPVLVMPLFNNSSRWATSTPSWCGGSWTWRRGRRRKYAACTSSTCPAARKPPTPP
jgi:hypothetical protein